MDKTRAKLLYTAAALVIPSSIYLILNPSIESFNSTWIKYLFTAVLTLNMAFIAYLIWVERRLLVNLLRITKRQAACLLAILVLGFMLRALLVPHAPRILFDEDIYLETAAMISQSGMTHFCNEWLDETCLSGSLDKHPNALPHTLAVLFLFFGQKIEISYFFITIIGSMTVVFTYFLARMLLKNDLSAFFSAFFMAISPTHIIWSGSISTEIYYIPLSMLVFMTVLAHAERGSLRVLTASAAVAAYAVQTRPESLLVFVQAIILLALWNRAKGAWHLIDSAVLFTVVFLVFSTLHLTHLNYSSKVSEWGAKDGKFGLKYAQKNIRESARFLIDNKRHLFLLTPLALVGVFAYGLRKLREKAFLLFCFLSFFILYLIFYAGAFGAGGTGSRFALMWYPPFVLLSGLGGAYAVERLSAFSNKKLLVAGVVFLSAVSFATTVGFISTVDHQADSARTTHYLGVSMSGQLDDKCVVISSVPAIFVFQGQSAVDMGIALRPGYTKDLLDQRGCVYFFEDYWCKYVKNEACDSFKNTYAMELKNHVKTIDGWDLAFYKLKTPKTGGAKTPT